MCLGVRFRKAQLLSHASLPVQKTRETKKSGKAVNTRHIKESW